MRLPRRAVRHPTLKPDEIAKAVTIATTPAVRLILAPVAVHAARPKTIRHLLLGDIDLGNRHIVIAGHSRPLDELTHRAILTGWILGAPAGPTPPILTH